MSLTSLEYTIREKAKQCNNTHFMIVGPMANIMNQKVARCPSSNFHAFGIDWYFFITSDDEKGYLSFYLSTAHKQSTNFDAEVECTYKLSLVSQTGGGDISKPPLKHCFKGKGDSWGRSKFVSYQEMEKYTVNDKAVFSAEFIDVNPKFSHTPTKGTAELLALTKEVPRNNSKFTWKITRFSSFAGESHSSYEFTAGNRRWKLEMYPKGNGDQGGAGHLSLFLVATDYESNTPKAPTFASYKLRVLDQLKLNHHEKHCGARFSLDETKWGIIKFLPLKELHDPSRGLLVNDEICIGVEFLVVSTYETL